MQIKGRKLEGPRTRVVPILRDAGEGGNIYFIVKGVADLQPFFEICPQPEAPVLKLPGGKTRLDTENAAYKAKVDTWWRIRSAWIFLKSIEATDGLQWDQVSMSAPETYPNYNKELMESGFSDGEITRLLTAVMEVNGLNESLVEEARQSFLITQAALRNGHASQTDEVQTTPSGKVVSA